MESMVHIENQLRLVLLPASTRNKMYYNLLLALYPGCDAATDPAGTVHCARQYVITQKP